MTRITGIIRMTGKTGMTKDDRNDYSEQVG